MASIDGENNKSSRLHNEPVKPWTPTPGPAHLTLQERFEKHAEWWGKVQEVAEQRGIDLDYGDPRTRESLFDEVNWRESTRGFRFDIKNLSLEEIQVLFTESHNFVAMNRPDEATHSQDDVIMLCGADFRPPYSDEVMQKLGSSFFEASGRDTPLSPEHLGIKGANFDFMRLDYADFKGTLYFGAREMDDKSYFRVRGASFNHADLRGCAWNGVALVGTGKEAEIEGALVDQRSYINGFVLDSYTTEYGERPNAELAHYVTLSCGDKKALANHTGEYHFQGQYESTHLGNDRFPGFQHQPYLVYWDIHHRPVPGIEERLQEEALTAGMSAIRDVMQLPAKPDRYRGTLPSVRENLGMFWAGVNAEGKPTIVDIRIFGDKPGSGYDIRRNAAFDNIPYGNPSDLSHYNHKLICEVGLMIEACFMIQEGFELSTAGRLKFKEEGSILGKAVATKNDAFFARLGGQQIIPFDSPIKMYVPKGNGRDLQKVPEVEIRNWGEEPTKVEGALGLLGINEDNPEIADVYRHVLQTDLSRDVTDCFHFSPRYGKPDGFDFAMTAMGYICALYGATHGGKALDKLLNDKGRTVSNGRMEGVHYGHGESYQYVEYGAHTHTPDFDATQDWISNARTGSSACRRLNEVGEALDGIRTTLGYESHAAFFQR